MGEKNRAGAADSKTGSSPEKRKGAPYWIKTITEKGVDGLATILMTFIFILGLAQVIWRWILNDPIVWSEEMIRLTYVWICYLGWVIAEKADSHIRITAILMAAVCLPHHHDCFFIADGILRNFPGTGRNKTYGCFF